tara:strand:+ start:1175 stop:2416 length:1242 start_codon:yes stop_codon:yes gene_type:complete
MLNKLDNHVICMPFNLQIEGKPSMYEGSPSWLRKRLDIFKKYCLNSFNNQTDKNFHLFLYCDSETPKNYREELLDLERNSDVITIVWDLSKFNWGYSTEEKEGLKTSILENYKRVRKNNSNEIICSRFENDDIPDVRYVEFVKQCHESYNIISLGKGIYWDIKTDQFLDSIFPAGPFISVKSTLDNFISPLEDEHHNYISKRLGTPIITDEPLWVQIIHGDNIWNRMDRMPGTPFRPHQPYFNQCFALDINQNLNKMAISDEMLEWLKINLPKGKTILEFGSGTGTIELTKYWNVCSVEQNEEWIGKAPKSKYIHAPLNHEDKWYDQEIVFNNIPKDYDLILVDGPMNSQYREGICQFWNKLNTNVPIIFDDSHWPPDKEVALQAASQLGKDWEEIKGWEKNFIVLKTEPIKE